MLTNNTSDSKEIKISAVNTDVLNSVESKKALENDQGKQLLNQNSGEVGMGIQVPIIAIDKLKTPYEKMQAPYKKG